MLTDAPNLLTVGRVLAVPALVAAFYLPGDVGMWTTCVLFSIAAITDFFDGYLARSWSMQSANSTKFNFAAAPRPRPRVSAR